MEDFIKPDRDRNGTGKQIKDTKYISVYFPSCSDLSKPAISNRWLLEIQDSKVIFKGPTSSSAARWGWTKKWRCKHLFFRQYTWFHLSCFIYGIASHHQSNLTCNHGDTCSNNSVCVCVCFPSRRSYTQTRLKSLDLRPTHTHTLYSSVMSARVSCRSINRREVMEASTREIYELAVKLLLFATNCLWLSSHCCSCFCELLFCPYKGLSHYHGPAFKGWYI